MRIVLHVPYGQVSQEAGVVHLLGNYLQKIFPDVVQLQCNGVFPLCNRDGESGWKRDFRTCCECSSEQARLAEWSGITILPLSQYLSAEDIKYTKAWGDSLAVTNLAAAEFEGREVFPLCEESLYARLGKRVPERDLHRHGELLRQLLLATARMSVAASKFNKSFMPDLSLVAGGKDFITRTFVKCSTDEGYPAAVLRWDMHARSLQVEQAGTGESISSDLFLENVVAMRSDYRTWPRELLEQIGKVLGFLGISTTQLTLPIAQ